MSHLYDALYIAVVTVQGLIIVMLFNQRVSVRSFYGFMAVDFWIQDLLVTLQYGWLGSPVFTGVAVLYTWLWWKNGGGDDTKRRLRGIIKRFEGTRRTAPVAA